MPDSTAAVSLFGSPAAATLATPLYARAHADAIDPALRWDASIARSAWDRLAALADEQGVDLQSIAAQDPAGVRGTIYRVREFDAQVRDVASRHEQIQVVSLGAGLCDRASRLVDLHARFISIDLAPVVNLRVQILPQDPSRNVAADVLGSDWHDEVDPLLPTVFLAEGLLMFLEPDQAVALVGACARLVDAPARFVADLYHDAAPGGTAEVTRRTGAPFRTAFGAPEELIAATPRWRVTDAVDIVARLGGEAASFAAGFAREHGAPPYAVLVLDSDGAAPTAP